MTCKTIRYGVAIAALVMAPLAANAADLPRPYKAAPYAPVVAPAYASWNGAYVGFNVGYGFGKSDWTAGGVAASPSPKGPLAGVTLGYNYQTGTWVWGIEGDYDWARLSGDATCGVTTCTTKLSSLGTVRARIGYAGWNNWLPYFTGGVGFGNVKASTVLGEQSSTRMGWTAGAGIEYAMWSNWSLKGEYLYVDLGKFDCGAACGGVGAADVSFKANILRAGLNYRF